MQATHFDAIILGGGGAGLMCALTAGQAGKRVLVIDHADTPGKKILISGGGRCNFTNVGAVPERYLSANPHFAKSALRRYTTRLGLTQAKWLVLTAVTLDATERIDAVRERLAALGAKNIGVIAEVEEA